MPQIIPIKELKNTSEISEMCHGTDEPIYITKNGYGDMVIMSMEVYEQMMMCSAVPCVIASIVICCFIRLRSSILPDA